MAKRISTHDNEPAAAMPFDPRRLHTRKEVAEGFRVVPRTVDRWTAQGLLRYAEFNGRKRYHGDDLNRAWQSALEKPA